MSLRIEHRVGVNAPPEDIWELLYDIPGWAGWNPIHPEASGAIRIGAQLDLALALPGRARRTIRPTVLEWVPLEQLHWRSSWWGGLARSIRYVEIEKLADESCIVSTGEIFSGILGDMVARDMGSALRRGLVQMNEAMKASAEALWRERKAATTSEVP